MAVTAVPVALPGPGARAAQARPVPSTNPNGGNGGNGGSPGA